MGCKESKFLPYAPGDEPDGVENGVTVSNEFVEGKQAEKIVVVTSKDLFSPECIFIQLVLLDKGISFEIRAKDTLPSVKYPFLATETNNIENLYDILGFIDLIPSRSSSCSLQPRSVDGKRRFDSALAALREIWQQLNNCLSHFKSYQGIAVDVVQGTNMADLAKHVTAFSQRIFTNLFNGPLYFDGNEVSAVDLAVWPLYIALPVLVNRLLLSTDPWSWGSVETDEKALKWKARMEKMSFVLNAGVDEVRILNSIEKHACGGPMSLVTLTLRSALLMLHSFCKDLSTPFDRSMRVDLMKELKSKWVEVSFVVAFVLSMLGCEVFDIIKDCSSSQKVHRSVEELRRLVHEFVAGTTFWRVRDDLNNLSSVRYNDCDTSISQHTINSSATTLRAGKPGLQSRVNICSEIDIKQPNSSSNTMADVVTADSPMGKLYQKVDGCLQQLLRLLNDSNRLIIENVIQCMSWEQQSVLVAQVMSAVRYREKLILACVLQGKSQNLLAKSKFATALRKGDDAIGLVQSNDASFSDLLKKIEEEEEVHDDCYSNRNDPELTSMVHQLSSELLFESVYRQTSPRSSRSADASPMIRIPSPESDFNNRQSPNQSDGVHASERQNNDGDAEISVERSVTQSGEDFDIGISKSFRLETDSVQETTAAGDDTGIPHFRHSLVTLCLMLSIEHQSCLIHQLEVMRDVKLVYPHKFPSFLQEMSIRNKPLVDRIADYDAALTPAGWPCMFAPIIELYLSPCHLDSMICELAFVNKSASIKPFIISDESSISSNIRLHLNDSCKVLMLPAAYLVSTVHRKPIVHGLREIVTQFHLCDIPNSDVDSMFQRTRDSIDNFLGCGTSNVRQCEDCLFKEIREIESHLAQDPRFDFICGEFGYMDITFFCLFVSKMPLLAKYKAMQLISCSLKEETNSGDGSKFPINPLPEALKIDCPLLQAWYDRTRSIIQPKCQPTKYSIEQVIKAEAVYIAPGPLHSVVIIHSASRVAAVKIFGQGKALHAAKPRRRDAVGQEMVKQLVDRWNAFVDVIELHSLSEDMTLFSSEESSGSLQQRHVRTKFRRRPPSRDAVIDIETSDALTDVALESANPIACIHEHDRISSMIDTISDILKRIMLVTDPNGTGYIDFSDYLHLIDEDEKFETISVDSKESGLELDDNGFISIAAGDPLSRNKIKKLKVSMMTSALGSSLKSFAELLNSHFSDEERGLSPHIAPIRRRTPSVSLDDDNVLSSNSHDDTELAMTWDEQSKILLQMFSHLQQSDQFDRPSSDNIPLLEINDISLRFHAYIIRYCSPELGMQYLNNIEISLQRLQRKMPDNGDVYTRFVSELSRSLIGSGFEECWSRLCFLDSSLSFKVRQGEILTTKERSSPRTAVTVEEMKEASPQTSNGKHLDRERVMLKSKSSSSTIKYTI